LHDVIYEMNIIQSIMFHYVRRQCLLWYKILTRMNRGTWEEYLLSYEHYIYRFILKSHHIQIIMFHYMKRQYLL